MDITGRSRRRVVTVVGGVQGVVLGVLHGGGLQVAGAAVVAELVLDEETGLIRVAAIAAVEVAGGGAVANEYQGVGTNVLDERGQLGDHPPGPVRVRGGVAAVVAPAALQAPGRSE